jgi:hypothetical protein
VITGEGFERGKSNRNVTLKEEIVLGRGNFGRDFESRGRYNIRVREMELLELTAMVLSC